MKSVWAYRDCRPIVKVTGSHQRTCVFGALSMDGKQLFRQYDEFNASTFLAYLKELKEVSKDDTVHGQGEAALQVQDS